MSMTKRNLLKTLIDVAEWWELNKDQIYMLTSNTYVKSKTIELDELDFVDEAIFELTNKSRDELLGEKL